MTTHFNTKPAHNFSIYISNKLLILLIFTMASISYLFYFLFVVVFSVKGDILDHHRVRTRLGAASTDRIKQACKSTRYPDPCNSMLTQPGRPQVGPDPAEVIQLAISISQDNLKGGQAMIQNILEASTGNANRSNAAKTCLEMLSYSSTRSSMASDALSRAMLRDSRAWLSAALAYQYDCWSGLKYVNDTSLVNQTMSYFDTVMILSTSNALSMLRAMDVFGPDTTKWVPPMTERDGFWEPVVGSGTGSETIGFGSLDGLNVDVEVCKDGGACKYTTIQEAVDSAPENLEWKNKYVIKIKEGIYEETIRVGFNKKNVVFLGDGMGKTVITGSLNTGLLGINTYHTATVGVLGDGFMASGITFQNTAGPEAHQAVAFRSDSDFSYVENCEFLGNQDTIYIHTLRQLFKSCRIEGNVDFIFGNAAAIFENCIILVRPRQLHPEKGETNSISAHGRTDPTQTTGFSFIGCFINGTQDYMTFYHQKPSRHKNYLGRPWKLYSRTVYINCTMESLIHPDGWLPWTGDFALNTLYYGEYGNSGPGANMSNRVPWSRQIPAEHVPTFYVQNFLQGDEWIARSS